MRPRSRAPLLGVRIGVLLAFLAACSACPGRLRPDAGRDGSVALANDVREVAAHDARDGADASGCPGDDAVWQRFPFACDLDVRIAVDPVRAVGRLRWAPCDWPAGACLEVINDWNERHIGSFAIAAGSPETGFRGLLGVLRSGTRDGRARYALTPLEGDPVLAFDERVPQPGRNGSFGRQEGTDRAAFLLERGVNPTTMQYWWISGPYSNAPIWRSLIATEISQFDHGMPMPIASSDDIILDAPEGMVRSNRATGEFTTITSETEMARVSGIQGFSMWGQTPVRDGMYFGYGDAYRPGSIWYVAPGVVPTSLHRAPDGGDIGALFTDGANLYWMEGPSLDTSRPRVATVAFYTAPATNTPAPLAARRIGGIASPYFLPDYVHGGGHIAYDPRDRTYRVLNIADGTYWTLSPPAGRYFAMLAFVSETEVGYVLGDLAGGPDVLRRIRLDALGPPEPTLPQRGQWCESVNGKEARSARGRAQGAGGTGVTEYADGAARCMERQEARVLDSYAMIASSRIREHPILPSPFFSLAVNSLPCDSAARRGGVSRVRAFLGDRLVDSVPRERKVHGLDAPERRGTARASVCLPPRGYARQDVLRSTGQFPPRLTLLPPDGSLQLSLSQSPAIRVVTEASQARALVARLRGARRVSIDVESNGMHAYRARVCVVQLCVSDPDRPANEVFLIDSIALEGPSILSPLFDHGGPEFIVHDVAYDARIMSAEGVQMTRVVDTSVHARMLGHAETGLVKLVSSRFGVQLSKRYQHDDWAKRPLSDAQVQYLVGDVVYLGPLAAQLAREAAERGIASEIAVETEYALARAHAEPDGAGRAPYTRLKGARQLTPAGRAVLRGLAEVRERYAEQNDLPPGRVMSNETIVTVARTRPRTARELRNAVGPRGYAAPLAGAILEAVAQGEVLGDVPEDERAWFANTVQPGGFESRRSREQKLIAWRKAASVARGVDPQVVLPGHALADIVAAAPTTLDALRAIAGLGEIRVARDGDAILGVLRTAGESEPTPSVR